MKKKIATLILTAAMVLSMAGCGNNTSAVQTSQSASSAESSAEETPTPEATETPSVTEEPATVPTPEPTTSPEAEPATTSTPVPTEEPKATYTYTDKSATMYAKSSVNVRNLPSTDGEKVGALNTNDAVAITGVCNETGWYRFELNGQDAYVSGNYLASEKAAVQVAPAENQSASSNTASTGVASTTGETPSSAASNNTQSADNNQNANSENQTSQESTSAASESTQNSQPSQDKMVWDGGEIKGYEQEDGSVTIVDNNGNVVEENAEILDDWGLEGDVSPVDEDAQQQAQDIINSRTEGQP